MALKTLVLAASLFSAGFAAPLDSSLEGSLEQRQSCSALWYVAVAMEREIR
jgi:hypothetical protein